MVHCVIRKSSSLRYVVLDISVEQHQAAAEPQTSPTNLGYESTCRLLSSTPTNAKNTRLILFFLSIDAVFLSRVLQCAAVPKVVYQEWFLQSSQLSMVDSVLGSFLSHSDSYKSIIILLLLNLNVRTTL